MFLRQENKNCEISGSHGGWYKDGCLLGHCAVLAASIIRAMIALMMEAAGTSEKSVNFCQTTRRNKPEDSYLQDKN
jgi:hypothetical protein